MLAQERMLSFYISSLDARVVYDADSTAGTWSQRRRFKLYLLPVIWRLLGWIEIWFLTYVGGYVMDVALGSNDHLGVSGAYTTP